MNRVDYADRCAKLMRLSRRESGKSQEYVAKAMGVSKKTVQNWEEGLSSIPIARLLEWFEVLKVPSDPYFFMLQHPEYDDIAPSSDDEKIKKALLDILDHFPQRESRLLLYILYGDHGSPPVRVLDLFVAYLKLKLNRRYQVARAIYDAYRIDEAKKELNDYEHINPDLDSLKICVESAFEAVINGYNIYKEK